MPRIIPRLETGLPARVTSFNHVTLRPLLNRGLGLVLVHYTGVNRTYRGMTQAQVNAVIKSINRWKPNEYNYVIDWAGRVYEFAGERRAAHATGFNDTGYGILMLNGVNDAMTNEQLFSFHFLLGMLAYSGATQPAPWVLGHYEVAATACPGPVKSRLHEMRTYDPTLHSMAA